MKLGLCVVGCGSFAKTFASSIQPLLPQINLYFASRDLAKAQAYSRMFHGAGAFGCYAEAAGDARVEAMYICTPHYLHTEHTALAASAGKHILIEKPIAITIEEGRRVIAIAEEAGVTLMVAENYRFMPAVRLCKELVDQGALGRIRIIQLHQETPYRPARWRSFYRRGNPQGAFSSVSGRRAGTRLCLSPHSNRGRPSGRGRTGLRRTFALRRESMPVSAG